MFNLFYRLTNMINTENLNTIDHHIAKTMLKNIDTLVESSIGEIADMCNVSKSTISKFVRKLGYEDYMDFKWFGMVTQGRLTYSDHTINITDYIAEYGVNQYLHVLNQDIVRLFNQSDFRLLDQLAKDIHDYASVAAFGTFYSETAALNLTYKMSLYHKHVYTCIDADKQLEYIKQADEKTLIILFSNLGNYINGDNIEYSVGTRRKIIEKTKAKIVLITSNRELKNTPGVDMYLFFDYTDKVQNHPILFQLLIEQIGIRYQELYCLPSIH